MKKAIFHPEAWVELGESVEFYEARLKGLGLRFLAAVEQTIERISTHPDAGSSLGRDFRRRIVPGFPYNVIYRAGKDSINLIAIAHQHRRPGYWRQRRDRR